MSGTMISNGQFESGSKKCTGHSSKAGPEGLRCFISRCIVGLLRHVLYNEKLGSDKV